MYRVSHPNKGIIPEDRWHEHDMRMDELRKEIAMAFSSGVMNQTVEVIGVMRIRTNEISL